MISLAKLKEFYECGFSLREIEELTGLPYSTVHGRLKASGVAMRKRGGNRKFPPHDEYNKTAFMYEDMKLSIYEISELLGIRHSTVQNRLRQRGVSMRTASESYALRYQRRGRRKRV